MSEDFELKISPEFLEKAEQDMTESLDKYGDPKLFTAYNRGGGPSCLIPRFDGAIHSSEWKEALWDKFVTAAPRPRTPSEQQYSDRKLRSRH